MVTGLFGVHSLKANVSLKLSKMKCFYATKIQNFKSSDSGNPSWWTPQTWCISPDTRCISPWHLLRSLLFSSHTSLLVRNWWGHRGMSLDERRHVSETDLFPAFALRSCQLTHCSPAHPPQLPSHADPNISESSAYPQNRSRPTDMQ